MKKIRGNIVLASWLVVATWCGAGCDYERTGFLCGAAIAPGSQTVRVCDGPGEVCVCATQKCARRDESCSESRLRYLEPPFELVDDETGTKSCVDVAHTGKLVRATDDTLICTDEDVTGADAAADAPAESADAAGADATTGGADAAAADATGADSGGEIDGASVSSDIELEGNEVLR